MQNLKSQRSETPVVVEQHDDDFLEYTIYYSEKPFRMENFTYFTDYREAWNFAIKQHSKGYYVGVMYIYDEN